MPLTSVQSQSHKHIAKETVTISGLSCSQVDLLSNDDEVKEVVQFVADNAKRLLNVDAARVIPVSSRLALDAKLAVEDGSTGVVPRHVLCVAWLRRAACK